MTNLPLICFYKNKYLLSYNYREVHLQPDELELFFTENKDKLILFRLNFEWGMKTKKKTQKTLHSNSIQNIFIIEKWDELSERELEEWLQQFSRLRPFKLAEKFVPMVDEDHYAQMLTHVKSCINQGDFYQLNLTLPFKGKSDQSPLEAFAHYHSRMAGSYHAFIPTTSGSLICLSPELFLKKDHTRYTTCPIKGTSANTPDAIEALLVSTKENAELSMIVDLLRNDLNISADLMSSKLLNHRQLMSLGHLVHTYSTIEAESSASLAQILPTLLPGGSISGCPKKRSVEEITSLEPFKRGYYTGIIGWQQGEFSESAIVIRSFWQDQNGDIFYHAGGGIVADSEIDHEYQEILLKSRRINP